VDLYEKVLDEFDKNIWDKDSLMIEAEKPNFECICENCSLIETPSPSFSPDNCSSNYSVCQNCLPSFFYDDKDFLIQCKR
jgi:hypothetical protein